MGEIMLLIPGSERERREETGKKNPNETSVTSGKCYFKNYFSQSSFYI